MIVVLSSLFLFPGATIPLVNISVQITANGNKMVGQIGYSLTCDVTVTGAENPSITYQWTKHNGTDTQIQVGTDRVVSFSPLRLSDAGQYTCQATAVSSPCSITKMDTHYITLQSEFRYKLSG